MIFRLIKYLVDRLVDISGFISGCLVILMAVLVLSEVFMRYVIKQPLMIADEFSAYLLVLISYLGVAWTWKENGHVRFTVLVERLPSKLEKGLRLITIIGAFVCSIILVRVSYSYLVHSIKLNMASASWLRTPLQPFQSSLLIGFGLLTLLLMIDIFKAILHIIKDKNNTKE